MWGRPGIWHGLYAGLHSGYTLGRAYSTTFDDVQASGLNVGGYVGYNMQFGSIVLGAEADGAWNMASGSKHFPGYAVVSAKDDFTGSLRVRAGYAFDNMLVYATGGFGAGRLDVAIDHGPVTARYAETLRGYAIGGGFEVKLSHNMSARIEALRYGLHERTFEFLTGYLPVSNQITTIRAGLTLHFD